jgi:hypothetical protein
LATQSLRIVESQLGPDAGVLGCVVLTLEHLLSADAVVEVLDLATSAEMPA